jgi:hypothetical protein
MRCDQKSKSWPFLPDHITCDGDQYGLTGTGIITNRHLQGIQSEICDALQHATTIVEFGKDGVPIRTDSPLLTYAMHSACKTFRHYNLKIDKEGNVLYDENNRPSEGSLCLRCDQSHACLFREINGQKLSIKNIMNRKEKSDDLRDLYEGIPNYFFKPYIFSERLVLQYDCPLLGFRELIFPIIFEKKTIAVFFVGQIILEGKQKFIEDMIKSLPSRFPNCFETYLLRNNKEDNSEIIVKEIIRKQHEWIDENQTERLLTPRKYDQLISNTIKELKEFEKLLDEEIKHQRIHYIKNIVSQEIKEFSKPFEPINSKNSIDDKMLNDIWQRVENTMNTFVEKFSLRYILVFGVKRLIHTSEDKLFLVGKTSRWNEILPKEQLNKIYIDASNFPQSYLVCSRNINAKYLESLKECNFNLLGDFQLVLLPVFPHQYSSIAFIVGYDKNNPSVAMENIPGEELDINLQSFDTLVVSTLAATLAHGEEEKAKKQLLYLGHEAGQLVAGLDWLRITYFENAYVVKKLPTTKVEDFCKDLKGFIGQMTFFFDMAKRIGTGEPPKVEMSEFLPFGEVLFKWKDTYRLESEKKCLQIRVPDWIRPDDPLRPAINADKFLFEQLVYNIVNNAEKYSYRGTKIDIDCKLEDNQANTHVLTVTNYGIYMAEGDDVYLPFVRRENEESVEGLGLGLYIAWLIVQAHNGKIKHICHPKPISRFNIPLIKPYIERSFEGKDTNLSVELEIELQRLKSSHDYERVIAFSDDRQTPKYKPEDVTLSKEIKKPTYKVTIIATIPTLKRRLQ